MSRNLNILCLLVTNTCEVLGDVFCIRIPIDDYVTSFLGEVKRKKGPDIPDDITPDRLIPWRPYSFFPGHPPDHLTDCVNELHLNTENGRAAMLLDKSSTLEENFPDPLPPKRIHIVVQLPLITGLKHKPEEQVGIAPFRTFSELSPYAMIPPSDAARPSTFQVYQRNAAIRLLDDRPNSDIRITPIALLYRPFGQFLDHIRNPPETVDDLDHRSLEYFVDEFAYLMCMHYEHGLFRRDELLPALNDILSCYDPPQYGLWTCIAAPIPNDQRTDIRLIGRGPAPEIIVQIMNEHGDDGGDPEIQLASYYTQIHSENLKSGHYDDLYESSLLPVLGVSIIGSYIGFGALVILDRPRFVALTPMLSACFPSDDEHARTVLLQAFCAACVLCSNIRKDTSLMLNHPSPPLKNRNCPYVRKIPAWQPTDDRNSELEFEILEVASQDETVKYWSENRSIYTAKIQDRLVLVKFTRQYCPELHFFCAERGHAPKLLGYGTVPGGWKAIVMEHIEGGAEKSSEHAFKHWAKWNDDLKMLVKDFHDKGWVHGNLREANFIVPTKEPDKIMLVDFDWGGEPGNVFYPRWMLDENLIYGMTTESYQITKENDVRVLTAALESLRRRLGVK